jgi:hypothetical protein
VYEGLTAGQLRERVQAARDVAAYMRQQRLLWVTYVGERPTPESEYQRGCVWVAAFQAGYRKATDDAESYYAELQRRWDAGLVTGGE